jgi:uridine kinase
VINGDDYHRWPRGHQKWQVYTHLNVRGSDVHRQFEHAVALSAGHSIVKGVYDHGTGQFTQPQEVDPGEYILFCGLHALSLDSQRRMFDLKVFSTRTRACAGSGSSGATGRNGTTLLSRRPRCWPRVKMTGPPTFCRSATRPTWCCA